MSSRPANADRPRTRNCHLASAVPPGSRLVAAIAPGFTMGFVTPSLPRSTAASELNGSPVAFAPIFLRACSGPSTAQASANTNGLATLMIGERAAASPAAYLVPVTSARQMPNRPGGTRDSAG